MGSNGNEQLSPFAAYFAEYAALQHAGVGHVDTVGVEGSSVARSRACPAAVSAPADRIMASYSRRGMQTAGMIKRLEHTLPDADGKERRHGLHERLVAVSENSRAPTFWRY